MKKKYKERDRLVRVEGKKERKKKWKKRDAGKEKERNKLKK